MDKPDDTLGAMASMVLIPMFMGIALALRNPDRYTQEEREKLATVLEKLASAGKDCLLTELMGDAVKEKDPAKGG